MQKPRRHHTKSRYGCDNCRQRRVKCDEQGPPCTNCILRRLSNCTYSRVTPASLIANVRRPSAGQRSGGSGGHPGPLNRDPQATVSGGASSSPTPPPPPPKPHAAVVDELELMHQFTAETYQSLCASELETRIWQVVVPRLALKHRYLMHGILALASLHIATTRDGDPSEDVLPYIDTGLEYHSMSLEPFRIAIGNLTPENCDAALAQSVVTTAISLALPQLTAVRGDNAMHRMTENIITIFELLQGVKKILTIGQRQSWVNLELFSRGEFWQKDRLAPLDGDTNAALDRLAALNGQQGLGVNEEVLKHLRHCFMKFASSPGPAPVLAWLAAVDKGFVDNLRQGRPLSMLVLAYWGILLGELDGKRWWARNSGRALVSELIASLSTQDGLWDECLGWVQQKLSQDPGVSVQSICEDDQNTPDFMF